MTLTAVSNSTDLATILEHYSRDGGVIVENLVDEDTIGAMRESVIRRARDERPGSTSDQALWQAFHGVNTIRFSQLGNLSPAFFKILENATFGKMADELLAPVCGSYWLNTAQAMLIGPAEPAQFLHRDSDNWSFVNKLTWPDTPEITINMVLALENVYEELGATRVIPGSHLWEDYQRQGLPEETVPAEIPAGSAIIYSGKTIHGGGANRTQDKWRMAMQMSFVAGWLTPEEACPLEYSIEKVAGLSPRAQRLLGFRSYNPAPHPAGKLWLKDFSDLDVVETASLAATKE